MTVKEFDAYYYNLTKAQKWDILCQLITNGAKGSVINTCNGQGYIVYNCSDLNALVECELYEELVENKK